MAKARFGNTIVGGIVPDMEIWYNGARGNIKFDGGLDIYGVNGHVDIKTGLVVSGITTLATGIVTTSANIVGGATVDQLNVTGVSTFNGAIDANAGATLNQLNVTGVSTLTGRLTATDINGASVNGVKLSHEGTQVAVTLGAGVSVSNTLRIGSLNGGTNNLSTLHGEVSYGQELSLIHI